MINLSKLEQAKKIIAKLEKQKENEELSINKLNSNLAKNAFNRESQSGLDTLHKYESKEKPASNRYEEIRTKINNLSQKKVEKFNNVTSTNKIIVNLAEQYTYDTSIFTDPSTKEVTENVLNDSGEIVSKVRRSYIKNSKNKRFKLKHISNSKQLHLTEFYNVVKSPQNDSCSEHANEFQSECIVSNSLIASKSKNQVEKCILQQKASILKYISTDFNENKILSIPVTKGKYCRPHLQKNNSKSEEKGVWDSFKNIKKGETELIVEKTNTNTELLAAQELKQANRVHIQEEQYLKQAVSKNSFSRTIDDFWNDVITSSKLQNPSNDPSTKETKFVKSFSIENTISTKDNKNTSSVPLTRYELTNVKKRLEGNITFDEFVESVIKSINSKSNVRDDNNCDSNTGIISNEEKNGCNKLKNYRSEETILSISSKQSDCNKEKQLCSYSDCDKEKCNNHVILIDENIDLFNHNNHHESRDEHKDLEKHKTYSTSQDIDTFWSQYIYDCVEGGRSQINQPNLMLENENSTTNVKALEEKDSSEEFYGCVGNCSQNEANLESQINFIENDIEKSILTAAYRKRKVSEEAEKNTVPFNLEGFLQDVIQNNEKKKTAPHKYNLKIKRYRKGKTKIYKLRRLKKKSLKTEEHNQDLSFHDLLKKMTKESYESQPRLSRFKSGSSISTSSSYVADDSKSDVLSTGSRELTSPQQRLRTGFNELSKDDSLLHSANEWEDISEYDKEDIQIKIQDLFFQILEDFKHKRSSYFRHKRQSFDNCIFKDTRLQFKPATESSMTVISSRAQRSKAKFQLMLHILKKIQTLLETGTKLTKRELYYQLKELVGDQRAVDSCINTISCLLNVGMWALNIIAQKGLVFGDLKLLLSSGEMLNCNVPGTLIPRDINEIAEIHSSAYFILVVEKESIFHKLIEEDLPNKLTRPFIMITGKGFPDLNTQLFLRKIWMVMSIPVFILVDADPHGINIMLNYRFGSVNNAHVSQHLAVPNAKWLGVYPSEITNLNITREPLNEREIKLVNRMLATPYMEFSPRLVDELQVLSTKKFKAGIEGLMKTDSYLSEVYLPNKFFNHNFI